MILILLIFIENLIVAAGTKLEYYTLLSNAVNMFRGYSPAYPNIGAHLTHVQNLCYIYNVIYKANLSIIKVIYVYCL